MQISSFQRNSLRWMYQLTRRINTGFLNPPFVIYSINETVLSLKERDGTPLSPNLVVYYDPLTQQCLFPRVARRGCEKYLCCLHIYKIVLSKGRSARGVRKTEILHQCLI